MLPNLQDLAAVGAVALGFDAWQHGEWGAEERAIWQIGCG